MAWLEQIWKGIMEEGTSWGRVWKERNSTWEGGTRETRAPNPLKNSTPNSAAAVPTAAMATPAARLMNPKPSGQEDAAATYLRSATCCMWLGGLASELLKRRVESRRVAPRGTTHEEGRKNGRGGRGARELERLARGGGAMATGGERQIIKRGGDMWSELVYEGSPAAASALSGWPRRGR